MAGHSAQNDIKGKTVYILKSTITLNNKDGHFYPVYSLAYSFSVGQTNIKQDTLLKLNVN